MLPMATSDVCELFGVSGIPMIVVVHPNGMITCRLPCIMDLSKDLLLVLMNIYQLFAAGMSIISILRAL